ncbi:hypothetical protein GCM10009664_44030 [Kitasatospora gansuensis]
MVPPYGKATSSLAGPPPPPVGFPRIRQPSLAAVHFWFEPPEQPQSWTVDPFAVPTSVTSRQRPERSLVILPSGWKVHFWLLVLLQPQVMTLVPLAVPSLLAPRHLPPIYNSRPAEYT